MTMYLPVAFLIILFSGVIHASDITVQNVREVLKDVDFGDLFKFNVGTFVKSYGYPFENHEVVTEDKYVLGVHRIPHGRNESDVAASSKKPVVLLMHGLLSSSVDFFILGPKRSLAMMLADAGYDVWLGNNRGNTWSRKHLTLDPDQDDRFWDFSFHELGVYDLPAIIDHILNTTGRETLSYIGHSQGTTEFFASMSMKPEYNGKINSMVGLATVVYMDHVTNDIFLSLKDLYEVVDLTTNALNITEFNPHSPLLSMALSLICSDRSPYQEVCTSIFFMMGGESDQFNKSTLSLFVQSYPAGASVKELKHYLQEIKSGHFRQFDHGILMNLLVYGRPDPPDYDLSKVTAPVTIISGGKDIMASEIDVKRLVEALPNVVSSLHISYYSHNDFLLGINAASLYKDIIQSLNVITQ